MDFLNKPSTDFAAVRDGRNSLPLWLDIDLTSARSIAAGTALSINIAGNSFYIDQDTANVGNATVHFQDTNLGATSAPLFVSAGFIANVPFTQILIENNAQAAKRLRIFYGVDIDFQAGINASIAISGTVDIGATAKQNMVTNQVTVTNASAYLTANKNYLLVQNNHPTANIYLAFGVTATLSNSIKVGPGGSFELSNPGMLNSVNVIGDIASNSNVVVMYGT